MAFLSGVLGAVKDDDAVKTYDIYMDNKLNNVLEKLTKKIGSGRAGLADAVAEVKRWLEGYGNTLNQKTENIKKRLNGLIRSINYQKEKFLNPEKNSLQEQLNSWNEALGSITQHMGETEHDHINRLDNKLRNNMNNEWKQIKASVKTLEDSAGREDFKRQVNAVDCSLIDEKMKLATAIGEETTKIENTVETEIWKILKKMENLCQTKNQEIKNIRGAIEMTKNAIQKEFGQSSGAFRTQVIQYFDNIHQDLADVNPFGNSHSHFHKDVEKIRRELGDISRTLNDHVRELQMWITDANNSIGLAQTDVLKIVNGDVAKFEHKEIKEAAERIKIETAALYGGGKMTKDNIQSWIKEAQGKIPGLENIYKNTLWSIKENIDRTVGENDDAVGSVLQNINDLENEVRQDLKTLRDRIIDELKKTFVTGLGTALQAAITQAASVNGYSDDKKGLKALSAQLVGKLGESETFSRLISQLANARNGSGNSLLATYMEGVLQYLDDGKSKNDATTNQLKSALSTDVTSKITGILKELMGNDDARGMLIKQFGEQRGEAFMSAFQKATCKDTGSGRGTLRVNIDRIKTHVAQIAKSNDSIIQEIGESSQRRNELNSQIGEIGTKVSSALGPIENLKGAIIKHAGNVETKLGEVTKAYADAGEAVEWYLDQLKRNNVDDRLVSIRNEIDNIRTNDLSDVINIGINNILVTIEELEKVPSGVVEKRQNAEMQMDRLKDEIIHRINHIDQVIIDANASIDSAITSVYEGIKTAKQGIQTALSQLQSTLLKQVETSFAHLTSAVRSLFAEQKKADLQALKGVVEEQKEKIEGLIDLDGLTGVKGFLKLFNEKFVKKIEEIGSLSSSELKKGGEKLFVIFEEFFEKFENQRNEVVGFADYIPRDAMFPERSTYNTLYDAVTILLDELIESEHFDHKFTDNLQSLTAALSTFTPTKFGERSSPILQAFKDGLSGLATELGKAYVNKYSGMRFTKLTEENIKEVQKDGGQKEKITVTDLTPEGRNCAKVCLTIVRILGDDFMTLKNKCIPKYGDWHNNNVFLFELKNNETKTENPLGAWLNGRGYKVSETKDSHNGELKISLNSKLNNIHGLLVNWGNTKYIFKHNDPKQDDRSLKRLYGHFENYYKVRHLETIPSPKQPCNIYQMLQWLSGIRHYPNLTQLFLCFKELFPKPEEDKQKNYKDIDRDKMKLLATTDIMYVHLAGKVFVNVSLHSHDVLSAVQGHGHAEGRYACDFSANEEKLLYPDKASDCFGMLVDISYRLYDQLSFLHTQCQRTYKANSWRDCWYGRGIAGSSWTCNEKLCPNQNCPQIADQKTNQTADQISRQTCDQHPKCGVKSPLQSFLEDGLQGFLPHQLTKVGCGVKCSVSNHGGITCKTPMGFADLSNVASHTKQGEYIMKALDAFCGQPDSSLSELCRSFSCLLSTPPRTLGDMFAFYYNFSYGWNIKGEGKDNDKTHRKDAFDDAVTKAYFGAEYEGMELSSLFNRDHSEHNKNRDLLSLVCGGDNISVTNCGRYLQPISANTWTVFSKRNAANYLSWIVYLTESFYKLLDQLYKECCENCTSVGSRCHGKTCVADCKVKSHYASVASAAESKTPAPAPTEHQHNELCKPISHCPFTRPTLCKYGFVFKSLSNMSGENGELTMRTCKDLCNALQKVLSDKIDDSAPLAKLVHETIPNFLYQIRFPFMSLTLALWLLSLLYLIHITVIRLDLLHIKSHLHSPSSHRIAAQSLLAAGRVNKLNRVFYLQP